MQKKSFPFLSLFLALSFFSAQALGQTVSGSAAKPAASTEKEVSLADMIILAPDALIDAANKILLKNKKEALTDAEKTELTRITTQWNKPLFIAVGIYFLILLAIVVHAIKHKRYYWAGFILVLGLSVTTIAWFVPLIYTRRYIARGKISHQLPYMIIQMLPIGLWWYAVSDVFDWVQNLLQLRGIMPGA